MSILSLAIGKSKYTVDCIDGEEDKIINLSKKLNERVNNLSLAIRTADEKTILMLCALTAEEELETAKNHNGVFGNQTPEKEEIVEHYLDLYADNNVDPSDKLKQKLYDYYEEEEDDTANN